MPRRIIRKLTIGEYKSPNAMHFVVGNTAGRTDKKHVISEIKFMDREHHQNGVRMWEIWLKDVIENTSMCWKEIGCGNSPFFVEHDLDF